MDYSKTDFIEALKRGKDVESFKKAKLPPRLFFTFEERPDYVREGHGGEGKEFTREEYEEIKAQYLAQPDDSFWPLLIEIEIVKPPYYPPEPEPEPEVKKPEPEPQPPVEYKPPRRYWVY